MLKTRSKSFFIFQTPRPHLTQCGFSRDVNGCECVHKKTLEPRLMKGPQKTVLYSILFSSSHVILACIGGHLRYITTRRIERVAFARGGGGGGGGGCSRRRERKAWGERHEKPKHFFKKDSSKSNFFVSSFLFVRKWNREFFQHCVPTYAYMPTMVQHSCSRPRNAHALALSDEGKGLPPPPLDSLPNTHTDRATYSLRISHTDTTV